MAKSTGNPPPAPGDAFVARLERMFAVIVEHVRNSPELAARIEHTLGEHPQPEPAPARAPAPRQRPAPLDPFLIYEQGWEAMLIQELIRLDSGQLRDVIREYDLDPDGTSKRVKNVERLREWIVKAVVKRAS